MAKSTVINSLEQLEEDIHKQARVVNQIQQESINAGRSTKGQEYERKQTEAEKRLQFLNTDYQKKLSKASNLLKKI